MSIKFDLLILFLIPLGLLFAKVIPLPIRILVCLLFAFASAFLGWFGLHASNTSAARTERVKTGIELSKDWLAGSQATADVACYSIMFWLYALILLTAVIIFLWRKPLK